MNTNSEIIMKRGEEIMNKMGQQKVSLFSKDFWYGSIMEWSMKNESFKTQMFRFVDVLPSLSSSDEVAKHLREYFTQNDGELPKVFNVGLGLGKLAPGLMASTIRTNVTQMAKMFIVGENPKEAIKALKNNRKNNLAFTIDILGEVTLSEKEAKLYGSHYLELMAALSQESKSWDHNPLLDEDHLGPIPKVNVSVKLTALYSQINECAWDESKSIIKDRLRPLFRQAMNQNLFLNLDMEHYGVKHLTLEVFKELINEEEFKFYRHFGCVIQAYLKDSFEDIQDLIIWAKKRGTAFTVRLVKGAYWDTETIEAKQKTWPIPVFTKKQETDANYEDCSFELLQAFPYIQVAFGSHNVRSIAYALETAKNLNIPAKALEIQMLYGMADPIKKTLIQMGIRVREYCPMGEMLPGMSYLVRRLLENTSNESWLRGKFADEKSIVELLGDPKNKLTESLALIRANKNKIDYQDPKLFYNEPLLDFAVTEHREKTLSAMTHELSPAAELYHVYPIINGKIITLPLPNLDRPNPSQSDQICAKVYLANTELANQAVSLAKDYYPQWKSTPANQRIQIINKLADLIHENRYSIIATQCIEVGKTWTEADADIAEAIDFCRYYAREMQHLAKPKQVASHVPGEVSLYHYQARGVALVISPWNFPLAILTGQVAAALITGNTVIIKPAEQSSRTGAWLMKLLLQAGLPPRAAHFLPGIGEEIGAHLVKHPDISLIAFTGSKAVGQWIHHQSSQVLPGQTQLKKCIIEMGGKNAIIVDNDADLDEAIGGVLYSAFGFSGQKCSACSRVIVLGDVYDKFIERLKEATLSLEVASALNPKAYTGPVVDQESQSRLLQAIEQAKKESSWLLTLDAPQNGYYVGPTIFTNVKPHHQLASQELFGPVLAVMKAQTIDEALMLANQCEYALTGGLFSRSPEVIEKVKWNFECGNLYINRGITGALVERHPFGGFKMSGIGSKTGGPDYLTHFMEPRVVTENTMRRGFAPEA